jgi:arylsulfatase A-like enzyme
MPRVDLRSTLVSLWFRLITLGILGLAFAQVLKLSQGEAQGWSYYLTTGELVFEAAVRIVFAALTGILLGTLATAVLAPLLWRFEARRESIAQWATKVAVIAVVFFDTRYALIVLVKSWHAVWAERYTTELLTLHFIVFVAALWIPRSRKQVVGSLDLFLGEKMTRRAALATVAGAAGLVITEYAISKSAPVVKAALAPQRPKSNLLLITFDALSAEDMSVYGYRLRTTPNIDAFARNATVFKNFYSASTFTTPSIATMLTGLHLSEHRVYQIIGRVSAENSRQSLPSAMRAAGYVTGAFVSNPYAYYIAHGMRGEWDFLPEPAFQAGGLQHLWDTSRPLHQDTGIGSRMDEYNDLTNVWNPLARVPLDMFRRYRASDTFEHAQQMLPQLPDGFFLWVHVMTPHSPYHPDPEDRNTFIPDSQLKTFEFEGDDGARRWFPHYPASDQPQVDQRRLAYDEFLSTGDRAFGNFMSALESSGRLANTTVVVSADHGESFEGGIYQHENQYLTRPVIHVPLIIRTPGQQQGHMVDYVADQTALAPTLLELGGAPKPSSMRGESLVKYLKPDTGETNAGEGLAYCQYFENNSIFKPLRYGTVGVIDGKYQYVIVLSSQHGALRPLKEAQFWNIDRTGDDPERARALMQAIYSKFPEVIPERT